MLLYLDTSAVVKLYVREAGSDKVRKGVVKSEQAATSALTYVEARAALARGERLGVLSATEHRMAKLRFEEAWHTWVVIEPTDTLLRRAADLAEGFSLRGYDSVHLASADYVRTFADEFVFGAFDQALNDAAKLLGMTLAF